MQISELSNPYLWLIIKSAKIKKHKLLKAAKLSLSKTQRAYNGLANLHINENGNLYTINDNSDYEIINSLIT